MKTLAVRRNISSYSTGSSYTCKGNGKKQMKTNSIMLSGQRTKKITRHDGQGYAPAKAISFVLQTTSCKMSQKSRNKMDGLLEIPTTCE